MATNGYRLIVVVGGDAALNSALNGLMAAVPDAAQRPTLAVIPNGLINGFAHFWGLNESDPEACVDRLLRGRVRKVDVGAAHLKLYKGKEENALLLELCELGIGSRYREIASPQPALLGRSGIVARIEQRVDAFVAAPLGASAFLHRRRSV